MVCEILNIVTKKRLATSMHYCVVSNKPNEIGILRQAWAHKTHWPSTQLVEHEHDSDHVTRRNYHNIDLLLPLSDTLMYIAHNMNRLSASINILLGESTADIAGQQLVKTRKVSAQRWLENNLVCLVLTTKNRSFLIGCLGRETD